MSNGLLGIDIEASQELAAILIGWSTQAEQARVEVVAAELLSDIPSGILGLLDEIGGDGATMAGAIERAAAALRSFTIQLASPRAIGAAVADIRAFQGRDNDPELDRRLRVLRELVNGSTGSATGDARVMAMLLATEKPLDFNGHDVIDVATAMATVERLTQEEQSGAISSNDARIDAATGALRAALSDYAPSESQLDVLVGRFLADRNETPTAVLLASVVSGVSPAAVSFAHEEGLEYDVAGGVLDMYQIDRLTTAIHTAPFPEVADLARERAGLFTGLIGADDRATVEQLERQVDSGLLAAEAFPAVVAIQQRAAHVVATAEALGIDQQRAAERFDEMATEVDDLDVGGWDREDAAISTSMAARLDLDLAEIEEFATNEGVSLVESALFAAQAQVFDMTIVEYTAYTGLVEHFDVFDNAMGGDADGIVSVSDLIHVAENPETYGVEVAAAAAALLAAPALRYRLDSAAVRGNVVGHESFGADRPEDQKISLSDTSLFEAKQGVNFVLSGLVDEIDVANQNGDLSRTDTKLREEDFRAALANAEELGLTPIEIQAIELVLEADWYDQNFWQEHGDTLILVSAVIAGAALVFFTGGLGVGLSGALITSAAGVAVGAGVGAGLTLAENALTGDDLTEDLLGNSLLGATGGLAGVGLYGAVSSLTNASVGVRAISAIGGTADLLGLGAAGAFDPLLVPFMDDIDVARWKGDAQTAGYVLGAAAVATGAGASVANRVRAGEVGDALAASTSANYVNYGAEGIDDSAAAWGSQLTGPPAMAGPSPSFVTPGMQRQELAGLLELADSQADDALVGIAQRVTGAGLDALQAPQIDELPEADVALGLAPAVQSSEQAAPSAQPQAPVPAADGVA